VTFLDHSYKIAKSPVDVNINDEYEELPLLMVIIGDQLSPRSRLIHRSILYLRNDLSDGPE
jgi:hypothetical protein